MWEWTEDHFNGLDGFETHRLYDDFSTPTFDGAHNLILGGSWASTGTEASLFARFAFRRHFFQHCGFRPVRPSASQPPPSVVYCEQTGSCPGVDCAQACVRPSTNTQLQCENDAWLRHLIQVLR